MGRPKLWFPDSVESDKFVHRSESFVLFREDTPDGKVWQLKSVASGNVQAVVYSWSPRRKNPPFGLANKKIADGFTAETPITDTPTTTEETAQTSD